MVNVLAHLQKGYGPAIACIKDLVDCGRRPDGTYTLADTHRGMSADQIAGASAVSSLTLAVMVRAGVRASDGYIDTEQLDSDLSFVLVDKAKLKSEIFNRIQNLKAQGGIKMYAEAYRWFTETSGLGLMGPAAKLMDPKPAAKEADVAEAIEQWEEKVNRLARHGEDRKLSEALREVALKTF